MFGDLIAVLDLELSSCDAADTTLLRIFSGSAVAVI